jgi:hypothetical protein
MRAILVGTAVLLTLAACNRRAGEAARTSREDTTVTTRQTEDTTVVRTDTSVRVDTTKKAGKRPTRVDTVKHDTMKH